MKKGRKQNKEKYELILSLRRGDSCVVNGVFYKKEEGGRSINKIADILRTEEQNTKKQNIWYYLKRYGDIS